jgi:hypothetical protein
MCVMGRQEEGGRCAVTHTLEYIEYTRVHGTLEHKKLTIH